MVVMIVVVMVFEPVRRVLGLKYQTPLPTIIPQHHLAALGHRAGPVFLTMNPCVKDRAWFVPNGCSLKLRYVGMCAGVCWCGKQV